MKSVSRWLFDLRRKFCRWLMEAWFSTSFVHGDPKRLIVGNRVSMANTLCNTRSGRIVIGDRVIFGHNVMLLTGMHDYTDTNQQTRRATLENAQRDIIIEEGAWVASGVVVLGPVRIGKNSVVVAGSLVCKDVPANVLAAGNPAMVIRPLTISQEVLGL